jgi:hypothetical protein
MPPGDSIHSAVINMPQGDSAEINMSQSVPSHSDTTLHNLESNRVTRTVGLSSTPQRVAIASKVLQVPPNKMFTPLLDIGTLPTYLEQLRVVGARTCALWATGVAQYYRHFKSGPLECARGVLFSLLELFTAQIRKEREGVRLEHLPSSKERYIDSSVYSLLRKFGQRTQAVE